MDSGEIPMKNFFFAFAAVALMSCSGIVADPPSASGYDVGLGDTVTVGGIRVLFEKAYYVTNDTYYVQEPKRIGVDIHISNTTSASIDYSSWMSWGDLVTSGGEQCTATIFFSANNASYFDGYQILPTATITDSMTFDAYTGSPSSVKVIGSIPFGEEPDFTLSFSLGELVEKAPTS
jgi:hypothetical protein